MILTFKSLDEAEAAVSSIFPSVRQLLLPGFERCTEVRGIRVSKEPKDEGDDQAVIDYWARLICKEDGSTEVEFVNVIQARFERIMEAAGDFADEIEVNYEGYAEAGYKDPACGIICLADWNDKSRYDRTTKTCITYDKTPSRVAKLLEKLGVEIEWSDEWITCENCHKLIRTNPDCMSWTPSYAFIGDCTCLCKNCIGEDPDDYFEQNSGSSVGIELDLDPEEHGYVQIYDGVQSERDWIAKTLKAAGVEDFLLTTSGECYLPKSYRGRIREIQALLENREPDLSDHLIDLTDALTYQGDES